MKLNELKEIASSLGEDKIIKMIKRQRSCVNVMAWCL